MRKNFEEGRGGGCGWHYIRIFRVERNIVLWHGPLFYGCTKAGNVSAKKHLEEKSWCIGSRRGHHVGSGHPAVGCGDVGSCCLLISEQ